MTFLRARLEGKTALITYTQILFRDQFPGSKEVFTDKSGAAECPSRSQQTVSKH